MIPESFDFEAMMAPPSPEALRTWAQNHLRLGRPFRVDAWPEALRAIAGPMVEVRLSEDERQALMTIWRVINGDEFDEATLDQVQQVEAALTDRLQAMVDFWDAGAFVRLNTRSPKDNFEWVDEHGKPRPLHSAKEAIRTLVGSMERVFDDLRAAQLAEEDDPVFIVVRPYFTFEPWREVRLFVEDGHLVGASQYFYREVFEDMVERTRGWQAILEHAVATLLPQLPWRSFTLDGWVDDSRAFRFLEVNPPVTAGVTDPALFRDGKLDGSFRLRT